MDERKRELLEYGMAKAVTREKRYKGFPDFKNWDDYYDKGNESTRLFYKQLDKFLLSNVNRPYEKVYGEFCAKWPARICRYVDTREAIRRECGTGATHGHRVGCYNQYNDFYVTDKGILKKNPLSFRFCQKPKKTITVGYNCKTEYHWVFNKEWLSYPDVIDYMEKTIGISTTSDIIREEYIPKKVINILESKWRWKDFFQEHRHWDDCKRWVYEQRSYSCPVTLKKGTNEYSRYISEERQSQELAYKRKKREREKKASTLLHDLEQKKKIKEEAQNLVDRDRLGFDEESFKGEFYHGQKRKKK